MNMFESFLASLPKNRSEMVNDLNLDEISLPPFVWTEPDPDLSLSVRSDSILSRSDSIEECDVRTASTDSSMPLSRAMTDSEIDYGMYRRLKNRSFSDPWDQMRNALDAFPADYLASLNSFQSSSPGLTDDTNKYERRLHNEELRQKMQRFFDEECRVFTPDDPGLLDLEDALQSIDLKSLEAELDRIAP